jgi:hypothetical protein
MWFGWCIESERKMTLRRGAGTKAESESLKRKAAKLGKRMRELKCKMQGLGVWREDRFSVRLLQLEVSQMVVLGCCELLPYCDNEDAELCRCHLQGPVMEQIKAEKRGVKRELKERLIVELEEWDMKGLFAPFLDGVHGALKELEEEEVMQEAEIRRTCVSLCMLAMAAAGEAYDLMWITEMLSGVSD